MAKKVLLTGVTGFLGSNIARRLLHEGYRVIGTHRESSSFKRVNDIFNLITWININGNSWEEEIKKEKPEILIHAAWEGVSLSARNNWELQLKNFEFSKSVFNVSVDCDVKKIISFGSQAEYGIYSEKVSEKHLPMPNDAYGAVKLLILYYLQNLVKRDHKEWYWLRVFSVFGQGENENCLIPQVIRNLRNRETIKLTAGNQVYDYLYSDNFITNFMKILTEESDKSGIYNLCSGLGIDIKSLINQIATNFPDGKSLLDFGKIPYRDNQNMYMVGNSEKFESAFGKISSENLKDSIIKTINSYQE